MDMLEIMQAMSRIQKLVINSEQDEEKVTDASLAIDVLTDFIAKEFNLGA